MPANLFFFLSAAALTGFSHLTQAQTNISASTCADSSSFSSCNAQVASSWGSCVNRCNGDGNCIVDCGCTAHQYYINCMAQSCWNQVYSCEYQLFIQQYFAVCPTATEPIPFWPAPDNAPGCCSCNLGKVLQVTLGARREQVKCMENLSGSATSNLNNWPNVNTGLAIAQKATECACCGASASISAAWQVCPHTIPQLAGANLWGVFFPADLPNMYDTIPNWAWATCDSTLSATKCKNIGFTDPSDRFYSPNNLPSNGTSTLYNVAGTVTAPPSGTVLTWSQAANTYTVTATGHIQLNAQNGNGGTNSGSYSPQTNSNSNAAPAVTDMKAIGVMGVLACAVVGFAVAL